jgi:hypothetical protein
MRPFARVIAGALLSACACLACAASRAGAPGVTNVQPSATQPPECLAPGSYCATDQQCCSGRCYEDTGCSG